MCGRACFTVAGMAQLKSIRSTYRMRLGSNPACGSGSNEMTFESELLSHIVERPEQSVGSV